MVFRKASAADVSAVEEIYNDIHTKEENGKLTIGWIRGIYPTRATAEGALERGELFVLEDKGRVVGAGIINQDQANCHGGRCAFSTHWWSPRPPRKEATARRSFVFMKNTPGRRAAKLAEWIRWNGTR